MGRLVYTTSAKTDLVEIAAYIAEISGEREVAAAYLTKLRAKCRELAQLPFPVGRLRPELGADLRSYAVGNHILFFKALEDVIVIIGVVEGHRDLSAVFERRT